MLHVVVLVNVFVNVSVKTTAHVEDTPPFLSPGVYKAISFLLLVLLVVGVVAAILFIRTKDQGQKRYF